MASPSNVGHREPSAPGTIATATSATPPTHPSSVLTPRRDGSPCVVVVSPFTYRLSWFLIAGFHLIHAALIMRACYSLGLTIRDPFQTITYLQAVGVRFHVVYLHMTIASCSVMVCIHIYEIVQLIRSSYKAKQLQLASYELSKEPIPLPQRGCQPLRRLQHAYRRFNWLCGTRSPYFEASYHAREALEIFLQSGQAYRVSSFVAHVWANQLATFVIVLNCWSSPLLYWIYSHDAAKRRLSCLMVDVILDFTSSMVIPYSIYVKYRALLPTKDIFDPVWIHQAANDIQQFTAISVIDVFLRLNAAVTMILSLQTIQALIRQRSAATTTSVVAIAPVPVPVSAAPSTESPGPTAAKALPRYRLSSKRWMMLVHTWFVLFGIGILVVYRVAFVRASNSHAVPGCRLSMRTWFGAHYPCAVFEINCFKRGITGTSEELTIALHQVDHLALSAIIISHCPAVSMSPAILTFPNLVWLEIYNSTLTEWPASAALTQETSSHLSRVLLIHVNVTTTTSSPFPVGLLPQTVAEYPATLVQLVFVDTNILTMLPSDLDAHWDPHRLESIIMEDCGLTQVPPQLEAFHPMEFSLADNDLTEIPSWVWSPIVAYTVFSIAGNPLSSVAIANNTTTRKPTFQRSTKTAVTKGVHLEFTKISTLPSWLLDDGVCSTIDLYAYGSPLCARGGFLVNESLACIPATTHCEEPPVPVRTSGRLFPIEVHESRRQPSGIEEMLVA